MAQPATVDVTHKSSRGEEILVDPSIAEIIGDPRQPNGPLPLAKAPGNMPGRVGFLATFSAIYGFMRHGVDHLLRERERYGDIHKGPFMGDESVVVWDADEIQKILNNDDRVL
jgi:hypothetical protein